MQRQKGVAILYSLILIYSEFKPLDGGQLLWSVAKEKRTPGCDAGQVPVCVSQYLRLKIESSYQSSINLRKFLS